MNVDCLRGAILSIPLTLCLLALLVVAPSCGGPPPSNAAHGGDAQASHGDGSEHDGEEKEDAIAVRVTDVVREPLASLYTTSATLRADKQATVTARTSGVIRELLVEEGHRVQADQALAGQLTEYLPAFCNQCELYEADQK